MDRRTALKLLGGAATALTGMPALAYAQNCSAVGSVAAGLNGHVPLKAAAAGRGRRFGTAVSTKHLQQDCDYRALVLRDCDTLVAEWEMKWAHLQPKPGSYNFSACDWLADFAQANGMALRGHTLIWHLGMPDWLEDQIRAGKAEALMVDFIAKVAGRYAGRISSWDVVNEALEPEHDRPDGLRNSPWLKALGPDYIAFAYKEAARHDPKADLVYNDYGFEHDGRWNRARRKAALGLIERLQRAGVRLKALGMQSHLRLGDPFDRGNLARFVKDVESLGVQPMITELDVRADRIKGSAERKDRMVADLYRAYLETVLENSSCNTVLTWGLSDKYSFHRRKNADDRPLPYDEQMRPKPALEAIRHALAA